MGKELIAETAAQINPAKAKQALDGILAAQIILNALAAGADAGQDFDEGLSAALRNAASLLNGPTGLIVTLAYA